MTAGTGAHRAGGAGDWRTWHGYAPLDAPTPQRVAAAAGDVLEGVRRWRLWSYLAFDVIRNQYARTVIGPWWLTLQTVAYVIGLAVLFGAVFKRPLEQFLPYVGCGYIAFSLIAGMTRNGAQLFLDEATGIVSNRQPLSVLALRSVAVEFLYFLHNLIIIVVFGLFGLLDLGLRSLLVVPGVLLIVVNGLSVGLWLGATVARFRDVGPLIASVLQMMAFFTPIFWRVDGLTRNARAGLVNWNPFYYLLEVFRSPLLGMPLRHVFTGALLITVANVALAAVVFVRTRSRIPYWVS